MEQAPTCSLGTLKSGRDRWQPSSPNLLWTKTLSFCFVSTHFTWFLFPTKLDFFFLFICGTLIWFLLSFVQLNNHLGYRLDLCHLKNNHSRNRTSLMSDELLNINAFLLFSLEHGEAYYCIFKKTQWWLVEQRILLHGITVACVRGGLAVWEASATTYLPSECFLFDLISLVWLFSTSLGLFFLECWDWPSINHLWLQPFSIIEIFFFLLKRKLLQCYASCPFKTIIAWHLCPSDSLTNMWAGTVPCWQMGVSVGSQETMYLHLVYLLRAGFPVGDVQTSVHPELSRLWIKGRHR